MTEAAHIHTLVNCMQAFNPEGPSGSISAPSNTYRSAHHRACVPSSSLPAHMQRASAAAANRGLRQHGLLKAQASNQQCRALQRDALHPFWHARCKKPGQSGNYYSQLRHPASGNSVLSAAPCEATMVRFGALSPATETRPDGGCWHHKAGASCCSAQCTRLSTHYLRHLGPRAQPSS